MKMRGEPNREFDALEAEQFEIVLDQAVEHDGRSALAVWMGVGDDLAHRVEDGFFERTTAALRPLGVRIDRSWPCADVAPLTAACRKLEDLGSTAEPLRRSRIARTQIPQTDHLSHVAELWTGNRAENHVRQWIDDVQVAGGVAVVEKVIASEEAIHSAALQEAACRHMHLMMYQAPRVHLCKRQRREQHSPERLSQRKQQHGGRDTRVQPSCGLKAEPHVDLASNRIGLEVEATIVGRVMKHRVRAPITVQECEAPVQRRRQAAAMHDGAVNEVLEEAQQHDATHATHPADLRHFHSSVVVQIELAQHFTRQ